MSQFTIDLRPYEPKVRAGRGGRPAGAGKVGNMLRPELYLRLIAFDGQGLAVARSDPLRIEFRDPPPNWPVGRGPAPPDPVVQPLRYQRARPYRWHFQCYAIATANVLAVHTGDRLDLCAPSKKAWYQEALEGIEDLAGGLVDLAASAIDWASSQWGSLKGSVVDAAVAVAKSTVGCGAECQWAMGAALDAGLAAAGVPPSLPNFDQVVDDLGQKGIDAVAQGIVEAAESQGVPVPKSIVADGIKQIVNQAKSAATSGGGVAGTFWKVDPAGLYAPATMVLNVSNPDANRSSAPYWVTVLSRPAGGGGPYFLPQQVAIPALQPGTSLQILVTLYPSQSPEAWMSHLLTPAQAKQVMVSSGLSGWANAMLAAEQTAKSVLDAWSKDYATRVHAFELQDYRGRSVATFNCAHPSGCQL